MVSYVSDWSLLQEASDLQPARMDEGSESFRSALDAAFRPYVKNHYFDGVYSVSRNGCNTTSQVAGLCTK